MVQSGDNNSGNEHKEEYTPEVEFEYLDADVWIKTEADGIQDVAYTEQVLEALEEEEEDEESDSDDEDE